MTFASRQRAGIFDACQSCLKNNVKCAPTPLIRLSKIVVQLCYTFDANQRWSKPNFRAVYSSTDSRSKWNLEMLVLSVRATTRTGYMVTSSNFPRWRPHEGTRCWVTSQLFSRPWSALFPQYFGNLAFEQ